MAVSRTWLPKVAGALALAACGGGVVGASPEGGVDGGDDVSTFPDGASGGPDVTTGSSGSSGGFGSSSSSGAGSSGSSGGSGSSSGGSGSSSGGNSSSSSGGSAPVDAGLYYGDGSFWIDGGAYPPPEGGTGAPTDASASDASTPCGTLAACCPTLSGGSQTLCNSVVAAGDPNNCATELSQLESQGDCLGETVLVSNNQVPPNRMVSDGNLVFWTTWTTGLFAVPVQGGAVTTLVSGPTGNNTIIQAGFLAVDDLNVYVVLAPGLVRIPKNGASPTLMSDPSLPVIGATSLGGTAYWIGAPPFDGGAGTYAVESAPLQGNGINAIAPNLPQGWNYSLIGVTSRTVFLAPSNGPVYSFTLGGPANPTLVSATMNDNFMQLSSDTTAVYCANSSGNNVSVADDGTVTPLGQGVNPSYIVSDDTSVYWLDQTMVGTVKKAPKSGGSATVLVYDANPTAIAVDATSIYWSDQQGYIKKIAK